MVAQISSLLMQVKILVLNHVLKIEVLNKEKDFVQINFLTKMLKISAIKIFALFAVVNISQHIRKSNHKNVKKLVKQLLL